MPVKKVTFDIAKIYQTKFNGPLKIVKYINYANIIVRFINTGYQTVANGGQIKIGNVKDYLKPNVYGIGFIGVGGHKSRKKYADNKVYRVWLSMLTRSYSKEYQGRNPTYKDCLVDPIWHNFQNFAEWFKLNYIKGHDLDKDIIKHGNKIYSPEFCKFVPSQENSEKAHSKHYSFISPNGVITKIYNLKKFCRENNLDQSAMRRVNLGENGYHKGWRKQDLLCGITLATSI
jgi:hypothetical protein